MMQFFSLLDPLLVLGRLLFRLAVPPDRGRLGPSVYSQTFSVMATRSVSSAAGPSSMILMCFGAAGVIVGGPRPSSAAWKGVKH